MKSLAGILRIEDGEIKGATLECMDLLLKLRSVIRYPYLLHRAEYIDRTLRAECRNLETTKKYRIEISEN